MSSPNSELPSVLTKSDKELVHEVEAVASDCWGEEYAISIRRWTDGTASIYAEHVVGLTSDGHRKKERLLPDGEGSFGLELVVETRSDIVKREEIEYPVDGTDRSD
jgi:hypothetical protein